MKTLILYASKTGTAKKCAERLACAIHPSEIACLDASKAKIPDFKEFDLIVFGGGVRDGKLPPSIIAFVKAHDELLATKFIAFFLCCADDSRAEQYFQKSIPAYILKNAVDAVSFGGELDESKAFAKKLKKSVEKAGGVYEVKLLDERINEFVNKII